MAFSGINPKLLLPLLGKLTEGERLTQNVVVAKTILHELAVSVHL